MFGMYINNIFSIQIFYLYLYFSFHMRSHLKKKDGENSNQTVMTKTVTQVIKYKIVYFKKYYIIH